jgi:PIN domain nuclease of toxin-antitoxin system
VTLNYLLDASALLALIFNEPGADRVLAVFDDSKIHALNLAEVMRKMVAIGKPIEEVIARCDDLNLNVIQNVLPRRLSGSVYRLATACA